MIGVWNDKLANMTAAFNARHGNKTKTFVHDTHGVFEAALKDPKVFSQTAGLKNTTTWCKAYEKCILPQIVVESLLTERSGAPTWYTKDPSCAYPVNEYFWLNNLHPTFPIHNATAASIVQLLGSRASRGRA
jgi:phospholipase/lecithinase/hemolysin